MQTDNQQADLIPLTEAGLARPDSRGRSASRPASANRGVSRPASTGSAY